MDTQNHAESVQTSEDCIIRAVSYSGSVSIVFNIVLVLFTRITHNHVEHD